MENEGESCCRWVSLWRDNVQPLITWPKKAHVYSVPQKWHSFMSCGGCQISPFDYDFCTISQPQGRSAITYKSRVRKGKRPSPALPKKLRLEKSACCSLLMINNPLKSHPVLPTLFYQLLCVIYIPLSLCCQTTLPSNLITQISSRHCGGDQIFYNVVLQNQHKWLWQ